MVLTPGIPIHLRGQSHYAIRNAHQNQVEQKQRKVRSTSCTTYQLNVVQQRCSPCSRFAEER